MDENIDFIKRKVVLFKLSNCCWIAPIRIGLLAIGYFNFLLSIISLLGSANDSFSPTIKKVQDVLLEDDASITVPLLAYAVEEASNVVLLAGVYRNDKVLLRAYFLYEVGVTVAGFVIYSTVLAALDILMKITVIAGTLFQCYILLLVRSTIVEIKEKEYASATNGDIILKDVTIIPKEPPLPIKNQPTKEIKVERSPPLENKIETEPKVEELQVPSTEPIEEEEESGKLKVENEKEKLKTIPEENVEIPKRKLNIFKKTTTYKKNNEQIKTKNESSKNEDVTTKNIDKNKTDEVSKKTEESSIIKNGESSTNC